MYQPMQTQKAQEGERVYTTVNLESMSVSALYTSDSGSSGVRLTMRPIGPNSQLHIHEGEGGTAHIKTRKEEYQNINSYDAAMLDLLMDRARLPKIKK